MRYIIIIIGSILMVEIGIAFILAMFAGIDALYEYIKTNSFILKNKNNKKSKRQRLNE